MKTMMMIGAAALALVASGASADPTVTFNGGSGATAPGTTVFEDFEGYAAGDSLGTGAAVFDHSVGGVSARPAYGSTGNFGTVVTGGEYKVSFGPASVFSFVLGSLDTYNALTLYFDGGAAPITYTGGQIINDLTFPSGNQISGETNGVVSYAVGSGPRIVGASFTSTGNSMEFDNLAVGGVPEPATWGLMILGFGAVGGAMRRRKAAVAYA